MVDRLFVLVVLGTFVSRCNGDSDAECKQTKKAEVCDGHGFCKDEYCYCEAGRVGPYCQIETCKESCGNGHCGLEGCVCPEGVTGKNCDQPAECLLGCSGHGKCTLDVQGPTKVKGGKGTIVKNICYCDLDWVGKDCDMHLCPFINGKLCGGRGNCLNGKCTCHKQYDGDACESSACNCGPHGKCVEKGVCKCETSWYGPKCEKKQCPGNCNLRGDCKDNGVCTCDPGWSELSCTHENCPLDCNHDLGWGECIDFKECKCAKGMGGLDCSTNQTAVPNLGMSGPIDVYDPCGKDCLDRCKMTCGTGKDYVFRVEPGRMLRTEIPKIQSEKEKMCLLRCSSDCRVNCLQGIEELSSDERDKKEIQLPALRGLDPEKPLEGQWADQVFADAANFSAVTYGEDVARL